MILVCEGQSTYTKEQADVLAEIKGYEDGDDLMCDLGYFCCIDCGNYIIEPGGWHDLYRGVLCEKCAAEYEKAQAA